MKGITEMKQGAHSFHVENSKAPLLEITKIVYKQGKKHLKRLLITWVLVILLINIINNQKITDIMVLLVTH